MSLVRLRLRPRRRGSNKTIARQDELENGRLARNQSPRSWRTRTLPIQTVRWARCPLCFWLIGQEILR